MKSGNSIKLKITASLLVLIGVACSKTDREIVFHANEKLQAIPGLDFEAVRTQVFDDQTPAKNHCARCHTWVNDYSAVISRLGQIRSRVLSGDMPRGQILPPEKKELLLAWIDSGAPLSAPEVGFELVKTKVFQPKCASCHAWILNYQSVAKSIDEIIFQIDMGFMPKNGSLSTEEKDLLSDWIEAGLPE